MIDFRYNSPFILTFCFWLFYSIWAFSQTTETLFQAEFYTMDGEICDATIYVQIGDGEFRNIFQETSSGKISVYLPIDMESVHLKTMGNWEVGFPPKAIFPNNNSYIWKVLILNKNDGTPSTESIIKKEINYLYKQGETNKEEMIQRITNSMDSLNEASHSQLDVELDSLINLLTLLQEENEKLENGFLNQQKVQKSKAIELFSSTISVYFSRVMDYKEEWRLRQATIFFQPDAIHHLNTRIKDMNTAYEDLNRNQSILIEQVDLHWNTLEKNPVLEFLEELRLDFHDRIVKNQGNDLLQKMDAHLQGAPKALSKKKLKLQIEEFVLKLERELARRQREFDRMLLLLKNN